MTLESVLRQAGPERAAVAMGLFPSEDRLDSVDVWKYRVKSVESVPDNLFRFGAQAAWKAGRANRVAVISSKLDLFATAPLSQLEVWDGAELSEVGKVSLRPSRDGRVIERLVDESLAASVPRDKYVFGFNYARELRPHRRNATGLIELYRGFRIQPRVFEDGTAALQVDLKHVIISQETVAGVLERGEDIEGLHAAHTYDGNTCVVVRTTDKTAADPMEDLGNKSLIEYHQDEGHIPAGTEIRPSTPIILVRYDERVYPHIPALLRPIMSLDALKEEDPTFASTVAAEVRRSISDRFALSGVLVRVLRPLLGGALRFRPVPSLAAELGFVTGQVTGANLEFGRGFAASFPAKGLREAGLYRAPPRVLAALLFPEGQNERAELFWESLQDVMETAFRIRMTRGPRKTYRHSDSLGYKDIAASFQPSEVDIVLAIVPQARVARGDEDADDPYDPFKRVFARLGIPSQMVAIRNVTDPSILLNLALGVVVKCGGLPWRIRNIPGRPECFVGLDISHRDGVHMAASAHLFDADGTYIGWNCVTAQKGETIAERDLLDAVEDVILAFKQKHGRFPADLVLHRDGRFTEETEGLVRLFRKHDIRFNLVEVRKSGAPRLGVAREGTYFTPNKGTYVVRGDVAHVCTTGEREYRIGTPRPITIRRALGSTGVDTLAEQAFWLSEMHVGSTHSTRLPITTHYADKCSTLAQYGLLPTGRIENRLYFV